MRQDDDDEPPGESVENRDGGDTDAAIVDGSASKSSLKADGRSVKNCVTSPSNEDASSIEAESDDGESVRGSLKVRLLTLLAIWAIL